jgi:hypothetical protein
VLSSTLLTKKYRKLKAQGTLGAIIGLGVGAIALLLIIIIVSQVDANVPSLTANSTANETYESAATQVYNALNLAPIILIVLVAGAVLGILVVFGGR